MSHDFMCQNCWNAYATPEQRARLPSTFSVADLIAGKDIVVIITKGDAEFQLTMWNAEKHGYELVNMTQSQDNWSFLETKRTLIFKKKKQSFMNVFRHILITNFPCFLSWYTMPIL